MAYQPKSYRKFLAASVSAVVAASAIAPVAASAASNNFKDVQAGTELADAVNYLVSTGTTNGESATEFGVHHDITRAQAAKMIAGVMGLDTKNVKDPGFPDVSKDNYYYSYIAAAANAGVFQGDGAGKFNPDKPITRAEAAKVFVKAFGLELKADAKTPFTDVPDASDANLGWATPYINTLYAAGLVKGTNDAGTTFEPNANLERGAFALLAYRVHNYLEELKAAPAVTSVSAINSKQLEVHFNKPIKSSSIIANTSTGALVPDTVTVSRTVSDTINPNKNVNTVVGSLSEDGKTLTLTADGTSFFDGTYYLEIADSVETTNGDSLKAYAGTVNVDDNVAPTVSSVSYNPSTGKIEIKTSEPLTRVPDVLRINGTPVTGLTAASASPSNTKFVVAKPASLTPGSNATIHIDGSEDYAGNLLTPYDGSVSITDDQSALQLVSTSQVSSNVAKLVFNKPLASDDTTIDGAITALIDGSSVDPGDVTFVKDPNDSTGKTVLATFAGSYTAPDYFYGTATSKAVTFVVADGKIQDVYGVKLGTTTQTVTMTKDVTGPKALSADISADGKYLLVHFDEVITTLNAGTSNANITLRLDGVDVPMDGKNADVQIIADENGDNTILEISPDNTVKLDAGTYTVRLAAGTVSDVHTNKSGIVSQSATVSSTSTPLTASIDNWGGNNNKFQVTFSEAVGTSALQRTNYTLDGSVLPEGTDIYFADSSKKTVNIVLPANSINFGAVGGSSSANNARLGVMNVTTASGKVVTSTSATVRVEDNTAAKLVSAQLVGSNVLKLTFNENMGSAFALEDIALESSAGTFSLVDTSVSNVETDGKSLIITVSPGTNDNYSKVVAGSNLKLTTVDVSDDDGLTDTIVDANGYHAEANDTVSVSK
jgi:hypothetical protein